MAEIENSWRAPAGSGAPSATPALSARQPHGAQVWAAVAVLLGAVLCSSGCATAAAMQTHLAVANVDAEGKPTVKFYRVTIKGSSTNVKSTLQTGYYDAGALRALYGEVKKQSDAGPADRTIGSTLFRYDRDAKAWQNLPPSELFTVMYGADADSLAKAVTAYADSAEVGEAMGRMLARAAGDEQSDDAVQAEQDRADAVKAANSLAAQVKEAAKNLKAAAEGEAAPERTPDKVDALLLRLAQEALVQLGSSTKLEPEDPATTYPRLKEAYDVLRENHQP